MLIRRMVPLAATIATDGLWLIGLGAFVVVLVALIPRAPRLHLQFGGQGDDRIDRVAYSMTTTGLLATATGSVLVAIGSTPSVRFVAATVIALVVSIWVLLAQQIRALWLARRHDAAMKLKENQDLKREAWELQATAILAQWRWTLLHPMTGSNAASWPNNYLHKRIGDAPLGIPPEWYSVEGRQLRYNQASLVRMTANDAPDWLHDIVVVAISEGWFVLGTPTVVAFYTPSGTQYETVVLTQPGLVRPLARMNLLRRLHELDFPMHHGSRGQTLPGHDTNDLVRRFVEATHPDFTQARD
jgi:hypothetical protein